MNLSQLFKVIVSIVRSLITVRAPSPDGADSLDHSRLRAVLTALDGGNSIGSADIDQQLTAYLDDMVSVDPDQLTETESLAYWINLYNAGALRLASRTEREGLSSVLRVPGGFDQPFVEVAGETLSLDAIEHAKIRRFGDPRIHAALGCGSASCPILRNLPYVGPDLDGQLSEQMGHFLARGGLRMDQSVSTVHLSKIFQWYGADFARPSSMPTFLPARRRRVLHELLRWVDSDTRETLVDLNPTVVFDSYDWSLRCSVGFNRQNSAIGATPFSVRRLGRCAMRGSPDRRLPGGRPLSAGRE